ncbi:pentatricopeptide repeat-containing protein [Pyrus ussuriensis x Pyrus communis]|uniref:Pentatricopeptide repeat-containing protein n=1 Tax=Pyrus ussuriensis x Pyrus communis TaxID=2448454 RepID=A0A5N5GWG6_9ROSA|nr:pentatricopeptide repeat-containing protein [Pyrus ussuriensis x Pyrus communis]
MALHLLLENHPGFWIPEADAVGDQSNLKLKEKASNGECRFLSEATIRRKDKPDWSSSFLTGNMIHLIALTVLKLAGRLVFS